MNTSSLGQYRKIQNLAVRTSFVNTKRAYVVTNLMIFVFLLGHFNFPHRMLNHKLPSPMQLNREPSPRHGGFVLVTHFSDQLTGSCGNLQSLQCLVGALPAQLKVVEPFLHYGSVLGVDIKTYLDPQDNSSTGSLNSHRKDAENTIRLSDLVDMRYWEKYGSDHNFAPLVPWEEFMEASAKLQLILLDHYCDDKPDTGKCMSCTNGFYSSDHFVSSAEKFADKYKLSIVRRVCYSWSNTYSKKSFMEMAYGPYKPEESVLLINHFGGVLLKGDRFRMRVDVPQCSKKSVLMKASTNLLSVVSEYTRKFIPEAKNDSYISVMLRLQYFGIRHKFSANMNSSQQIEETGRCLNNVLKHIADLKKKKKISSIFLATDTGKYGSLYFRQSKNHLFGIGTLEEIVNNFTRKLFEGTVTQEKLTERIEAVIPVQSSGYVALLERHLAANGRCLVLVGGGQFQRAAYDLHQKERPGCVLMNIKGC